MAEVCYNFESPTCLSSCAGHNELQAGEQVILTLSDKNPLWPETIVADVRAVVFGKVGDPYKRLYTFCYDNTLLNGGPELEGCDLEGEPRCYGCCDENAEEIAALDERVSDIENGSIATDTNTSPVLNDHTFSDDTENPNTFSAPIPFTDIDGNAIGEVNLILDADGICAKRVEHIAHKGDIASGNKIVTVTDFNPATMNIEHVEIDASIVDPETDFFHLTGHRNGNQFYLSNNPDNSYADGLVVYTSIKC